MCSFHRKCPRTPHFRLLKLLILSISFSYPEPFLRAVNGRRRGALAKSISNWHLIGYNEGYCSNNVYIFYHVFMVSGFGFGQSPSSHRAKEGLWVRECVYIYIILVPRALLTRGQPSATRGSGQIHIKLASDWPQRNIWFIVNMNKNTQALHEALVSLWRKLGENTLLMLK